MISNLLGHSCLYGQCCVDEDRVELDWFPSLDAIAMLIHSIKLLSIASAGSMLSPFMTFVFI